MDDLFSIKTLQKLQNVQNNQNIQPNEKNQNNSSENIKTSPENLKLSTDYRVLVLSGGGTKGVVILGMLHRLVNKKLDSNEDDKFINYLSNLEVIIGTSIGSIIGFLLLIGISPVEILSHICTTEFGVDKNFNILSLISRCGLMSFDFLFDKIHKLTEDTLGFIPTMSELYELVPKNFVCVTHNMTTDDTVYIDHESHPNLSCLEALKMSCNIPLIFEKYMYDKCFYIDGAISDNFAVEYASIRYPDKKILGLYTEEVPLSITENEQGIVSYLRVLLMMSFRLNCKRSKNFKSPNVHSIMITINKGLDIGINILCKSENFNLFSIGYKVLQMIDGSLNEGEKEKKD